jgi:hypothetical protein
VDDVHVFFHPTEERARDWQSIVRASYPHAPISYQSVFGAHVTGVRVSSITPAWRRPRRRQRGARIRRHGDRAADGALARASPARREQAAEQAQAAATRRPAAARSR